MKSYLVADRYARSLSSAITDDGALESTLAALQAIADAFESHHNLHSVIANPAIPMETRTGIVRAILDRAETPPLLQRLVETMIRRGRITILADVAELFARETDRRLKRVGAQVTSAVTLTDDQAQAIAASLETYSGMHVRIENIVDPEILGGVTARIGGTVIDGSTRARIERLKQSLLPEENLGG